MAGAGFKLFTTGEVLTSSDANTYLAQQVCMVFDSSSARTTALGANLAEGMLTYLKDTNAVEVYDGSSFVGFGDLTAVSAGTNIDVTSGTGPVPTVALAIDAAVAMGSDGSGVDVTFHSSTAGDNMLWDASEEKLVITGTNGQNALEVADGDVAITDALTVNGTTTTYLNDLTDSGTARTPALTDASAYILCTHGSGMTITLPQHSAVAFPVGSNIIFERNGAGTLTFAAGTGATVNSKGSTLTCADRYTTVACVKIAADTWTIFGNLG